MGSSLRQTRQPPFPSCPPGAAHEAIGPQHGGGARSVEVQSTEHSGGRREKERRMSRRSNHLRSLSLVSVLLASVLVGAAMATALEVGEQAPDFTLPSTLGTEISLSQFRGKQLVLLEFYAQDFSPV